MPLYLDTLQLDELTADPTSPPDGCIWYNGTEKKWKKRENGVTKVIADTDPHAGDHTDGTDDIQDATASQKGLATAAQITKLNGIEAAAEVTNTTKVAAAGAVMDSDISATEGMLRKTAAGAYEAIKSNLGATTDPGATDDSAAGYAVGSLWINVTLDKVFQNVDATPTLAVWRDLSAAGGGSAEVDAQDTEVTKDSTTTSATFEDVPGASLTTSNTATTKYLITFTGTIESAPANKVITMGVMVDGVDSARSARPIDLPSAGTPSPFATSFIVSLANGKVVKGRWTIDAGTGTIRTGVLTIYGIN